VAWIVGLQGLYLVLMLSYPVPGCSGDPWTRECNFASFVNEAMRQTGMWFPPHQGSPDGVGTLLSATTSVLVGVVFGQLFRRYQERRVRLSGSVAIGSGLILGGVLLATWVPINKSLWTSSYTVFMAGISTLCFGACYWLAARPTIGRLLKPFEIFGLNAIAAYALAILGSNIPKVHMLGVSLDEMLLRYVTPANASLLYALANVAVVYAVVYWMYRRGWFLKL
jgi:predicted acyltransferase